MDDYANHRNQRNQIFEDRGGKIENRQPQHPVIESLNGLLKDTARAHRDSARGGGAGRGVPTNSADLGYDPATVTTTTTTTWPEIRAPGR
jgi:hypothetical protein